MPIHEKSLIRPENLVEHEHLVIDGVDVSGHWSTFIEGRSITDYNEAMQDEIAALPEGGKAVMAEWVGLAQRRMAALAAVSALAQTVE